MLESRILRNSSDVQSNRLYRAPYRNTMLDRLRKLLGEADGPGLPAVTAEEANAKRGKKGVMLVDVREPHEFNDAHIPGALLMPLGSVSARWRELNDHQEVIVVCRSGNRSQHACRQLHSLGVTQAVNLTGGMISWSAARLPMNSK
jgi:rhodanese-related sulfurtransferase